MIPKPKGRCGQHAGGYQLIDVMGLSDRKPVYNRLCVYFYVMQLLIVDDGYPAHYSKAYRQVSGYKPHAFSTKGQTTCRESHPKGQFACYTCIYAWFSNDFI